MSKLDTESTIRLIIDGKQAQTSLRDVTSAVNATRQALNNMRREDDPAAYQERIRSYQQLIEVQRAMRTEITQGTQATKGFFSDFKKGFSEIEEMAGRITIGTLIYKGVSSAIEGVKDLFNGSIEAYDEAQRTQTQLQQVIKTTGGVAGETREKLEGYQKTLMDQTGIDDDVIAKGEEMLLTFTNIRGKIYEQALPAIVDMTAAMNGGKVTMEGIQATSIQVGKALNDPINGMAALKKVGVTLDDQQKQQIKTMQESNNMMGAQAVILKELQKEFGGTAKAVADTDVGAMQKFETRIGNIKESIGELLTRGQSLMADFLNPFLSLLENFLNTPVEDKLRDEQLELNNLVGAITATNDNQAVRNQLIAELQAKYPDFLGNIDKESASNELLTRRLKEANEQYRQKIFLAVNEDKIKDIEERRKNAIEQQIDATKRLVALSGKTPDQLSAMSDTDVTALSMKYLQQVQAAQNRNTNNDAGSAAGSMAENDFNTFLNGRKVLADLDKEEAELTGQNAKIQKQMTDEKIKAIDIEIAKVQELLKVEKNKDKQDSDRREIARLQAEKNGLLGIVEKPTSGPSAADQKKADDGKQKAKELYDSLMEQARSFDAKQLAEQQAANDKAVSMLAEQYDHEIAEQKKGLDKLSANTKASAEEKAGVQANIDKLTKEKGPAIDALRLKQQQDLNDKIKKFEETLTNVKATELQKQIDKINEFYDAQAKTVGKNEDQQKTINAARDNDIKTAKLQEEERFQEDVQRIKEEGVLTDDQRRNIELVKIAQKFDKEREDLLNKYSQELRDKQEFKDAMAAIDTNESNAINQGTKPAKVEGGSLFHFKDKKNEWNAKSAEDKKNITEQESAKAAMSTAQDVANTIFSIKANSAKAETDAKIKQLEDQKTAELNVAGLTAAQKQAINDKYTKLENAEKLKAWKAQQSASAEQVLINGAIGITKTFAEYGFTPPGWIAAAALAVSTAAQEATILTQRPPQFAEGAFIPRGPSHAEGGINLVNNKTGKVIGEMEGDEPVLILPKDTSQSHLNMVKQLAFDAAFKNGARVHAANVSTGIAMAKSGMYIPGTSNSSGTAPNYAGNSNSTNSDRLDKIESLLHDFIDKQSKINQIPVVVNRTTFDLEDARTAQIKRDATV